MTAQGGGSQPKTAAVKFSEPEDKESRSPSVDLGPGRKSAAGSSQGPFGRLMTIASTLRRPCRLPRIALWRRPASSTFKQNFVVLRHSVRKDYVDPTYQTSEEGKAWPHDAPLTPDGITLAQEVADELAKLHEKAQFMYIACSPYRRCLETATEVSLRLGKPGKPLPIVIDQEIGEVRDRNMPEDHLAHRSPMELSEMAKELKIKLLNNVLEDGSIKIFGKQPSWPETLEDAKNRYVVRMETYIRKSAEDKSNMIIVTHADAVAAALVMFERGSADVQKMDFCARIIASRNVKEGATAVKASKKEHEQQHGVFAEQWAVEAKGIGAELMKEEGAMGKYYEKLYIEKCDETEEMVAKRKKKRTKTDMLFDSALKDMSKLGIDDDEDEDDEEKGEPSCADNRA
mmetsp:Transcript_64694/g.162806  ORF Transcript_64694/g.162806 Transcript_64694/m.162806 type:complete len:401 (+) Transcript_64694:111-1313(+)